ncbi:hypothetical protein [Streptomyces viridosporus]|uniref:hypothetical protein n=1 Tax=Streptomyces viridosporus TaxID=67581 RepID=UPI001319C196|nr:hypothetical protein [Streptomyces viridosporus]
MTYYTPGDPNWMHHAGKLLCGPIPVSATDPLRSFLANQHKLLHFFGGIFRLAQRMDQTLDVLFEEQTSESGRPLREGMFQYEREMRKDQEIIDDLRVMRCVDHFLTYISQLLGLLFTENPHMLAHSNSEYKLKDVLRHPDMNAFLRHAAESEVRSLSYKGMRELYRDIKGKFGFRIFEDAGDLNFAVEAVAIRNLLVHNNGIIDSRFSSEVARFKGDEGNKVRSFHATHIETFFTLAAADIDERARLKWGLPAGSAEFSHECRRFDSVAENKAKCHHRSCASSTDRQSRSSQNTDQHRSLS